MMHVGNEQVTYLCRYCGLDLTRLYYPDGPYGRLVAGAWFHPTTKDRRCQPRVVGANGLDQVAAPTQWTEVAGSE